MYPLIAFNDGKLIGVDGSTALLADVYEFLDGAFCEVATHSVDYILDVATTSDVVDCLHEDNGFTEFVWIELNHCVHVFSIKNLHVTSPLERIGLRKVYYVVLPP